MCKYSTVNTKYTVLTAGRVRDACVLEPHLSDHDVGSMGLGCPRFHAPVSQSFYSNRTNRVIKITFKNTLMETSEKQVPARWGSSPTASDAFG